MTAFRRIGLRLALTLTLALLFAVVPSGTQAQSSLNSGTLTSGTAITATTPFFTTGSSNCFAIQVNGGAAWQCGGLNEGNAGLETRKDDGKGPTLVQVKQARHALKDGELPPVHYAALARSVGLETRAEEATLLQAIADNNLTVYPFAKVDDYLYRQALKMGTRYRWVWKPVGKKSLDAVSQSGIAYGATANVGLVMAKNYTREVPVRILTEMKTLQGCLPGAVFLVSDYEVVRPDPFLAISTEALLAEGKVWIVDQWDEPGFTEKGQPVNVPAPAPAQPSLVATR